MSRGGVPCPGWSASKGRATRVYVPSRELHRSDFPGGGIDISGILGFAIDPESSVSRGQGGEPRRRRRHLIELESAWIGPPTETAHSERALQHALSVHAERAFVFRSRGHRRRGSPYEDDAEEQDPSRSRHGSERRL